MCKTKTQRVCSNQNYVQIKKLFQKIIFGCLFGNKNRDYFKFQSHPPLKRLNNINNEILRMSTVFTIFTRIIIIIIICIIYCELFFYQRINGNVQYTVFELMVLK